MDFPSDHPGLVQSPQFNCNPSSVQEKLHLSKIALSWPFTFSTYRHHSEQQNAPVLCFYVQMLIKWSTLFAQLPSPPIFKYYLFLHQSHVETFTAPFCLPVTVGQSDWLSNTDAWCKALFELLSTFTADEWCTTSSSQPFPALLSTKLSHFLHTNYCNAT